MTHFTPPSPPHLKSEMGGIKGGTFGEEVTRELEERGYPVLMGIFDRQADFMARYSWTGKTVIEFGAYDGRHSEAAIRLGAESATVIEGRAENLRYANPLEPGKVRFVVGDVRTPPWPPPFTERNGGGRYDVGLIFGILYHLDNPVLFLERALKLCKEAVFIWTHVAETVNKTCEGYSGQAYSDPGRSDNDALEPLEAFWFSIFELNRCLFDLGWVITDMVDMPTPRAPFPAVCLRAERL